MIDNIRTAFLIITSKLLSNRYLHNKHSVFNTIKKYIIELSVLIKLKKLNSSDILEENEWKIYTSFPKKVDSNGKVVNK